MQSLCSKMNSEIIGSIYYFYFDMTNKKFRLLIYVETAYRYIFTYQI